MNVDSAPPPSPGSVSGPVAGVDGVTLFRHALFTQTPRVWVTRVLVAVNVAVFVVMVATGVSLMTPSVDSLLRWGADYGPRTTAGEWWRLITNTFVHVGLIHLAMNMFGLWQIGALVERLLGGWTFLLVYLFSGLCGSLASIAWHPFVVSAGASGAVFGVYGVLIAYLVRHRGSIPRPVLAELQKNTLIFIVLNVAFGLQQKGIDMAAHVGGLSGGFLAALVVSRPLLAPPPSRAAVWRTMVVVTLAAVLVAAAVMLLPRSIDVQGELQAFQRVEQQAIDTYNGALQRRRAGELSDDRLAQVVEQQVLPPWRAYHAHLGTLKSLPPAQATWIAGIAEYMTLRAQGWSTFAEALRSGDDAKANQAKSLHQRAEALMNRQVPQPPQ